MVRFHVPPQLHPALAAALDRLLVAERAFRFNEGAGLLSEHGRQTGLDACQRFEQAQARIEPIFGVLQQAARTAGIPVQRARLALQDRDLQHAASLASDLSTRCKASQGRHQASLARDAAEAAGEVQLRLAIAQEAQAALDELEARVFGNFAEQYAADLDAFLASARIALSTLEAINRQPQRLAA